MKAEHFIKYCIPVIVGISFMVAQLLAPYIHISEDTQRILTIVGAGAIIGLVLYVILTLIYEWAKVALKGW